MKDTEQTQETPSRKSKKSNPRYIAEKLQNTKSYDDLEKLTEGQTGYLSKEKKTLFS